MSDRLFIPPCQSWAITPVWSAARNESGMFTPRRNPSWTTSVERCAGWSWTTQRSAAFIFQHLSEPNCGKLYRNTDVYLLNGHVWQSSVNIPHLVLLLQLSDSEIQAYSDRYRARRDEMHAFNMVSFYLRKDSTASLVLSSSYTWRDFHHNNRFGFSVKYFHSCKLPLPLKKKKKRKKITALQGITWEWLYRGRWKAASVIFCSH